MKALEALVNEGRIAWAPYARGWIAKPGDIVDALAREGFAEFKAHAARSRHGREPAGGLWQGLDARTGAVASAIWIREEASDRAVVFVDVDGRSIDS
ncbi:MAG TPA: hypothetical protein VEA38_05655 [Terriglobales bacterium]|nr:hypothetical protein [Terriglobales bacterium]